MIRAGFAQFAPRRYDVDANAAQVRRLLAGVKADLMVLPELANSGYLYARPEDIAPFSEPGDGSGPFLSALREMAGQMGGVIVSGFAEKAGQCLYNSAAAVSATGVLAVYRKTHLFGGEKDLFSPGDSGFQVLPLPAFTLGMMICFDWFFPESARTLALRGAQVLAHPANLVLPYCQQAMLTRSLENRVFTVTANRTGEETLGGQTLGFTGASQATDPRGSRLLQAPAEGECVQLCEFDPSLALDKRVTPQNDLFADCRPEMYA
ncbi:MAG TPA: nitrilase-related carbon-nitrogen hydrolase [Anaerolineaceae bacterium]